MTLVQGIVEIANLRKVTVGDININILNDPSEAEHVQEMLLRPDASGGCMAH